MRNALLALLLASPAAATGSVCDRTLPRATTPVPESLWAVADQGRYGIVDYTFYSDRGDASMRVVAMKAQGSYPGLGAMSVKWTWEVDSEVFVRREEPGAENEPVCVRRRTIPAMNLQFLYERLKPKLKR